MTETDACGATAPPPIVYFVCLLVGLGLDYLWPVPILPQTVQYAVGFPIIALSFLLFGSVLREFTRVNTSITHGKPTTRIVSTGSFAYSRNPVDVSMTMLMLGIAIAADSLWIVVMAAPAVVIVQHFVIRREEAYLERKFGDEYRRYKAAVRRWI